MHALRDDLVSCYFDLSIWAKVCPHAGMRGGGVFGGIGVKDPVFGQAFC